jgi:hypothetical protein
MENDYLEQFQLLNGYIETAIANKDYLRAEALDRARREILRDVCLLNIDVMDIDFFNMLEDCARQNALLIQSVEENMRQVSWETSRSLKAKKAYFNQA